MPPRPIWSLRRSSGSRSPCPSTAFPAPHANLLQLAATVGAHRDLRHQPRGYRARRPRPLRCPRGGRDRGRHGGRHPRERRRPGDHPSPPRADLNSPGRRWRDQVTAAAALLAGVSYLVWDLLDDALGRGTVAQIASLGTALIAGASAYFGAVLALRVPGGHSDPLCSSAGSRRVRVPRSSTGPGAAPRGPVARVGELAAVERQTAAPDALRSGRP